MNLQAALRARERSGGRPPKTAAEERRSNVRWGIAGVFGVIVLAAAFGLVHFATFGVTTYSAEMTDAGAIRAGDDVRIAGIDVGEVTSVTLEPDHVDVRFTVARDVFVGDQTTLDVRMLTIVGGHYLAMFPAGSKPLGSQSIPRERVTLPYSLPEVFQDAIEPVHEIDGNVLRQNLGALEASFDAEPQSVSTLLTAAEHLVGVLDRQNGDVSRTLNVADEYLSTLNGNRAVVGRMIRSLGLLETLIENNMFAAESLTKTAEAVDGIAGLAQEWPRLRPMAQSLSDWIGPVDELGNKLGLLLDSVKDLLSELQPFVADGPPSIDQSTVTLQARALCIPVPGRTC